MHGFWTALVVATGAAIMATPAAAATMLNVGWTSDCSKSTCFNDNGVFTQTWSSAGIRGPMTIGQFLLERGVLGDLDSQTFNISFTIGGQDVGTWGNYNMSGIGGDELTFDGLDFVWNPEDGDLVLTLSIVPPPKAGAGGGGGLSLGGEDIGRDPGIGGRDGGFQPQDASGGPGEDQGPGLGAAAVPEPATWGLMMAGFGLVGATLRQRRRLLAAA